MCRSKGSLHEQTLDRDAWIKKVDMPKFKADMDALAEELRKGEGEKDVRHLSRLVLVCDVLLVVGLAGLGMEPSYVFPWVCLGVAITLRWCAVAHHISHGGYSRCGPAGYKRGNFAAGGFVARARDWLDWMLPEAWDIEHNTLHHYNTNELEDPDFVQRNFEPFRELEIPRWAKLMMLPFGMATWKWMYYAVNTWKHLELETARRAGKTFDKETMERAEHPVLGYQLFGKVEQKLTRPLTMFFRVFAPYIFLRLVLPVAFFYVVAGSEAAWNAVFNLALAETWANLHSFVIVVPNHAGDDMYYYSSHVKPFTASFYLRQIIGSANYHTGSNPSYPSWVNDLIDGSQGWLNYQIEHHCFPNLSMVSYRTAQPRVKEICKRHGIPYVQNPIWTRIYKTSQIATGAASMRAFPTKYEVAADMGVQKMHQN